MGLILELARARQRIKELEKQLIPPPPPVLRREYSYEELYNILLKKCPNAQIFISGYKRYACDVADIDIFLERDETNRFKYVSEQDDPKRQLECEHFTFMLMGQFSIPGWAPVSKGIVWTDKHALMGFLDANQELWWLEPQTDKRKRDLEAWQGSQVRLIMM